MVKKQPGKQCFKNFAKQPKPKEKKPTPINEAFAKKTIEGKAAGKINAEIVDGLQRLCRKYELEKNKGKMMAYRRAVNTLKTYGEPILSANQLRDLPGLGASICSKIEEYFRWGKFKEIEAPFDDDKMAAIEELKGIHGVGDEKARRLYDKGFKSVADLRTKQGGLLELTEIQKTGLKYYEQLQEKIPREEVIEIQKTFQDLTKKHFDDKLQIEICGSFRRGRMECGDVDVLVTTVDPQGDVSMILHELTTEFEKDGFLKERLGKDREAKTGSHTYLGLCQLPKREDGTEMKRRRIDIKVYPAYQFGYAIMYFTGSMQLNLAMRGMALQNGFSMSDAGIYKLRETQNPSRMHQKMSLIAEKTAAKQAVVEWEIFRAFHIRYIPPEDREAELFSSYMPR